MRYGTRMTVKLNSLVVLLAACAFATACGDDPSGSTFPPSFDPRAPRATPVPTPSPAPIALELDVASDRADMISGGDVVVTFNMPVGLHPSELDLLVDGRGSSFASWDLDDGRRAILYEGLPLGESELQVVAGASSDTISVVNYPSTGPIFSGPHLPLPVCSTEAHGLGPALDENCSAETQIRYFYFNTEGEYLPLEDPDVLPEDVANLNDSTIPFVIREEVGTINRAIYWITVVDPTPGLRTWGNRLWNRRLIYQFGGGCGTTYTQGFRLQGAPSRAALEAGYAFATATFNTLQVMCNDVLSAETMLMVKERFSERYGIPELTIGQGGSGGAIQQYLIGQNYPGLLDALSPTVPFADVITTSAGVLDCSLLINFYANVEEEWTEEQQTAVNGHLVSGTCGFWDLSFAPGVRATEGCAVGIAGSLPGVPALGGVDPALIYHPEDNPGGLRCTVQDTNVNIVGIDPETGFGRRAWDNAGVQYGLAALNDGVISLDQFLELNESIGGFDADGNIQTERSAATEETIRLAYETGRVVTGDGNLREIPIITTDIWTDDQADIHDRLRAFSVRERLRLDDGTNAPGHMIWTRDPAGASLIDSFRGGTDLGGGAIGTLDEWLTNLADTTGDERLAALEATRPERAIDNCVTRDGDQFSGLDLYDNPGPCTDPYPISGGPRIVAGAPVSEDIIKCSRQSVADAIAAGVYAVDIGAAAQARLEAIFPDGVCDYTVPGVGQVPLRGTWLRY